MTARNTPATAPTTAPEPPRTTAAALSPTSLPHPDWCDLDRCTATKAAAKGEAHRSTPITITAERPLGDLTVTASLYQAHARWLTSVLVELDICGRDERWQPARLAATITVEQAGDLARALGDLATSGIAGHTRQRADDPSAVRGQGVAR